MATIKGNSGNNNLTGTTDNDFIYGYDGQDTLTGLAGNDRLEAGNSNDTLDGGTGVDTMIGGSGDDTYIVDHASDAIVEVPGEGVDTISTSISYTLGENYVNNLTLIGSSHLNGTALLILEWIFNEFSSFEASNPPSIQQRPKISNAIFRGLSNFKMNKLLISIES